ncbi:MAG: 30S ribosomal protein S19e [Candidatus Aenigmatarchaeota archaeon]
MVTAREIEPAKLVERLKEELKKIEEIKPPEWAKFVKSGVHKQRPPEQLDFWYIRAASILRRIYLDGPVGVERLRSYYGGRRKRGYFPQHFRKASGSIVRKILQQLEKAGLVEKTAKGRKITSRGQKILDRIAYEIKSQSSEKNG